MQRWLKKVWKTEKFLNSSKSHGHNSCKNDSITLKRKLELELSTIQSNKPSFNHIAAKIATKSPEN
jgi:hypothetical protein